MSTKHIDNMLVDLLYGEVDPDTKQRLHAHMDTCPACRAEFESLQATRNTVGEILGDDVPQPSTSANILRQARLTASAITQKKEKRHGWNFVPALAMGATLVLLGVFTWTLFKSPLAPAPHVIEPSERVVAHGAAAQPDDAGEHTMARNIAPAAAAESTEESSDSHVTKEMVKLDAQKKPAEEQPKRVLQNNEGTSIDRTDKAVQTSSQRDVAGAPKQHDNAQATRASKKDGMSAKKAEPASSKRAERKKEQSRNKTDEALSALKGGKALPTDDEFKDEEEDSRQGIIAKRSGGAASGSALGTSETQDGAAARGGGTWTCPMKLPKRLSPTSSIGPNKQSRQTWTR